MKEETRRSIWHVFFVIPSIIFSVTLYRYIEVMLNQDSFLMPVFVFLVGGLYGEMAFRTVEKSNNFLKAVVYIMAFAGLFYIRHMLKDAYGYQVF